MKGNTPTANQGNGSVLTTPAALSFAQGTFSLHIPAWDKTLRRPKNPFGETQGCHSYRNGSTAVGMFLHMNNSRALVLALKIPPCQSADNGPPVENALSKYKAPGTSAGGFQENLR